MTQGIDRGSTSDQLHATPTTSWAGVLHHASRLVGVESDGLVAFGDGTEDDRLVLTWAQTLTIAVAQQPLHMVGNAGDRAPVVPPFVSERPPTPLT